MNIFATLNKANENIMEYYSPPQQPMPMQPPMQQPMPMAFGPMQPSMPMQRPISMPTRSSEKKKDDDDSFGDFIKLLGAAGLVGGGGYLAYNHFKEPAWKSTVKDGASMATDMASAMFPMVNDKMEQDRAKISSVEARMKERGVSKEYRERVRRGIKADFEDQYGKLLGGHYHKAATDPNSPQAKVIDNFGRFLNMYSQLKQAK